MQIRNGRPGDVERAIEISRAAVEATHGFLTAEDHAEIDAMVARDFLRGFVRTGRSETDPQGRPYPLVHLKYVGAS